ncbi:MAG: glycosyltransferase [Candidatus Omnitrophica bacterium]|nr:glycosyltransferase [Candidatus Omnitrophota bacterium]
MDVRIIILNYNGENLLPQCLPSIVEAARRAKYPAKITLLDNLSLDAGVAYAAQHFPEVEIVHAPQNRVLCSYNEYLPHVKEPIVILLNNDIRVAPDFVEPLVQRFLSDPQTFLVAPRVMTFDGSKIEAAKTKAGMRFGLFWANARYPGYEEESLTPSETFSSGFGAFSRDKFLALKGYDDEYMPGIMEDVDLCYRARQAGFHLYYEPSSVVYHIGQAAFKKRFGRWKISVIAHRNTFLFMWKNFSGFKFWFNHLFFLPLRLVIATLKGNFALPVGLFEAIMIRIARG